MKRLVLGAAAAAAVAGLCAAARNREAATARPGCEGASAAARHRLGRCCSTVTTGTGSACRSVHDEAGGDA